MNASYLIPPSPCTLINSGHLHAYRGGSLLLSVQRTFQIQTLQGCSGLSFHVTGLSSVVKNCAGRATRTPSWLTSVANHGHCTLALYYHTAYSAPTFSFGETTRSTLLIGFFHAQRCIFLMISSGRGSNKHLQAITFVVRN